MVTDPTGFAHTAGGENDFGNRIGIDQLGFFRGNRQSQTVKPDGVDSLTDHGQGFLIKIVGGTLEKNAGCLNGKGRVHIYRETAVPFYQTLLLDLPDGIKYLLGAAHGERGNDHISPAIQGFLDVARQLLHHIGADLLMETVTVGGLNHQIVCFRNGLGVLQQRLVEVAHVSAEHNFPGFAVLCQPQLNGGGAKQMSHIRHPQDDSLSYPQRLLIPARTQKLDGSQGIFQGIAGFHNRLAGPLRLSAAPGCFGLLNVGRVPEHDITQAAGCFRGVNRAGEAVLAEFGQHS